MKAGKELEEKVSLAVRNLVASGTLGLDPGSCKIFMGKGYYSRDRNKEIVVDLSIELVPPGTNEAALIWIWECKDYGKPVSVSHVEEFHSKLEQIGADKTKGTMITTARYQTSAIMYAQSKGIGLTRLVDGSRVEVLPIPGLYSPAPARAVCEAALTFAGRVMKWNSFTHPIAESATEYFFSLSFRNDNVVLGIYSEELRPLLVQELSDEYSRPKG
jgi:hypothetical protein